MSNPKYSQYLLSPEWAGLKQLAYMKHGTKCICGRKATEIHHLTYKRIFNERLNDLIPLCGTCHGIYHELEEKAKNCEPTPDPELVKTLTVERDKQLKAYLDAKHKEKV